MENTVSAIISLTLYGLFGKFVSLISYLFANIFIDLDTELNDTNI